MKRRNYNILAGLCCALPMAGLLTTSCDDFLDRPTEDNFTCADFYKTDDQVQQAANTVYGSPWFDYQRGLMWVLEPLAGNLKKSDDDVFTLMITSNASTDPYLQGMSNSIWAVIAQSNQQMDNIRLYGNGASSEAKAKYTGEIMVFKAMAIFDAVRIWGSVPIIHSTADIVSSGTSFDLRRNKKIDVYKYIISTLQRAAELLPEENSPGRVDKYSAYGLLSKVYLTAAGVDGTLNKTFLQKSKEYAEIIYDNYSKHPLEPVYPDLWRISTGDNNKEGLITTHWYALYDPYTAINQIHVDINMGSTFSGTQGWGSSSVPTRGYQALFGVDPLVIPSSIIRADTLDQRRRGNMLLYRDYIWYWWRDSQDQTLAANGINKKGFYASWNYSTNVDEANGLYPMLGEAESSGNTGAQCVKFIHGHVNDHVAECGIIPQEQGSNTPIHFLRTADVLLCYAEADFLLNGSVTGKALEAWNKVQERAYSGNTARYDAVPTTIEGFLDQRRKELGFEGENWFDLVRLSYYDPATAKEYLKNNDRGYYNVSLAEYYQGKLIGQPGGYATLDDLLESENNVHKYYDNIPVNQVGEEFTIPYSQDDYVSNPNLREEAVDYDFSQVDYYDESKIY